jgi:DNA replication protein DnaC
MTVRSNEENPRAFQRLVAESLKAKTPTALKQSLGERTEVCTEHGEYPSTGVRYLGKREIWTSCPDCEEARLAGKRQAEAQEQAEVARARLEAMLGQAAIPKRFLERSLDNFVAETAEHLRALGIAREFAENFTYHAERGDGLILSGLPGTGKSHLANAILQFVMPAHAGMYLTCAGLIRAVRATWSRDTERTEVEVLRELGTVALLVIDEVGVSSGTDNEQALIFDVLDRRYRDMRPTILLTNQDRGGFKTFVGERVYDRLRETAQWVAFDWASYRPTARKEFAAEHAQRAGAPSNEPKFHRNSTGT